MGKKLDVLLGRSSRHITKLNTLLSLAVSRISVLRNHRLVRCNQARSDVQKLLELGQIESALLRVEQVIKEQNMYDVFVMVESYSNLIAERSVLLEHQSECPQELKEAASSLIFSASRSGELTELHQIKDVMKSMFGKEFVSAAVELRNNCGVNPKMIYKFSTRQPSLEIREKVLKEIAAEFDIKLNLGDEHSSENTEGTSNRKQSVVKLDDIVDYDEDRFVSPKKYKDVGSAAQAAFQSAAIAAAAARAAVELSQAESRGKGDDDQSKGGGHTLAKEHSRIKDAHAGNDNYEPQQTQDEVASQERLGKGLQRSSSSSSSDSDELTPKSDIGRARFFAGRGHGATSLYNSSAAGNHSQEKFRIR